jgi:type II secretory pathway pseudopilin PulG
VTCQWHSIACRTATAKPDVDTNRTARSADRRPFQQQKKEACMRDRSLLASGDGPAAPKPSPISQRRQVLLSGVGISLSSSLGTPGLAPVTPAAAQAQATSPSIRAIDSAMQRRALEVRQACARQASEVPIAPHPANDDEVRYPTRIGTDTRALPHNARGEVEQAAWQAMFEACQSGDPADFEKIPLGGTRRLGNPVGPLAVSLSGIAPTQIAIPAAPALASAERAAEAAEVYWQALLRDVPFSEYQDGTSHPGVLAAAAELSRLPGFRGAKTDGRVTPGTLFRGGVLYFDPADPRGRAVTPAGVLDGPMVSQFLLRDIPFGAQWISARIRPSTPESDFLTEYEQWLRAQNGQPVSGRPRFEPTTRYIANGRDLAELVRQGLTSPIALGLLLGTPSAETDPQFGGMFPAAQAPLSPTNPYRRLRTQSAGGATFASTHLQAVLAQAINCGPRAAYWQKWYVHRTLRPEAYGGLAQQRLADGVTDYPLHADFLRSEALDRTRAKQGSYLLSQTFPDGSPVFSAYPGGGASIGGAMATVLKAFFDESRVIANPVQPDPADPTRLVPYSGPSLTVGGELNKLGMNFAMGRNWTGIHWWSDAAASMAIGEEVAIALLRDERMTIREPFEGFSLVRFDGTRVTA